MPQTSIEHADLRQSPFDDNALCTRKFFASGLLIIVAALLPALVLITLVLPGAQSLAHEDYWQILPKLFDAQGRFIGFSHWPITTNEHPVILPALLYAANSAIAGGSNRSLVCLSWLIALSEVLVLCALVPASLRSSRSFVLIVLIISAFVFSPAAAGNWTMGYAGIHLGLGNLIAFLTFSFFARSYFQRSRSALAATLLFGWAGTFTNTPALFVWLACAAVVLFTPSLPRRFILIPFSFALAIPFNLILCQANYPSLQNLLPFALREKFTFMLATLGSPFSGNIFAATIFGCLGVVLAALIFFEGTIKRRAAELDSVGLTLLLIAVYSLLICISAGLVRGGTEIGAVVIQRYRFFAFPFWIATIVAGSRLAGTSNFARRMMPTGRSAHAVFMWNLIIAILAFRTWAIGLPLLDVYLKREDSARSVAISLQLDIPDRGWIRNSLSQTPQDLLDLLPRLRLMAHEPFAPDDPTCPRWNSEIASASSAPGGGAFNGAEVFLENGLRVTGTIDLNRTNAERIIISNQDGRVRGCALVSPVGGLLTLFAPSKDANWRGYARTISSDKELLAYASAKEELGLYQLGTLPLELVKQSSPLAARVVLRQKGKNALPN